MHEFKTQKGKQKLIDILPGFKQVKKKKEVSENQNPKCPFEEFQSPTRRACYSLEEIGFNL